MMLSWIKSILGLGITALLVTGCWGQGGHGAGGSKSAPALTEQTAGAFSPFPARVYHRPGLKITVGEMRMIMRGPMFPELTRFQDNSVIAFGSAETEGGPVSFIRSTDNGKSWKVFNPAVTYNWLQVPLKNGKCINASAMPSPVKDKPGFFAGGRSESLDNGLTNSSSAPTSVYLPPDHFDPKLPQQFHGNMIEMPNGDLLAAMQGHHVVKNLRKGWKLGAGELAFRTFLVKSTDIGFNWKYVSMIADVNNISDPEGKYSQGWNLWGPCEPAIVALDDKNLVCVARTVCDDIAPVNGPSGETYENLFTTINGSEIYPGLGAGKYFSTGPRTPPLTISFSENGGNTWSVPAPMKQACGVMPKMIKSSNGVIALSYGALYSPRWGNAISFSTDGGKSWTDEIVYGPFFTSGYTGLVETAPGKFLVLFDNAAPQPWIRHAAHWVAAVDISVERK